MNKKEKLIQMLLKEQPLTSSVLSNQLDVSIRTVKNYIYQINDEYPETIISSRLGYSINKDHAYDVLRDLLSEEKGIPQTSKERIMFLLNKLLKSHQDDLFNIYDISDELYISPSTIRNELKKVKRKLNKYDIELILKGDSFKIDGLEKNKRKMLSSILYEESDIHFLNLDTLQQSFRNINIDLIKSIILSEFQKYHYFINDYSLSNLVLHLALSIERIRDDNHYIQNNQTINEDLIEYKLAKDLAFQLENYFQITFSKAEVFEMTLLIASRASSFNYRTMKISDLEEFVGKDCLDLVYSLVDDIKSLYSIDLSDPEFLMRFTLHIYNLIIRSHNNYLSKNPLTKEIKTSYPLIYDMSVTIAKIIIEKTNVHINDDEIAYITFHIGSILETQKSFATKLPIAIFCPNYYDLSYKLIDSIQQYFSNDVIISHVFTNENDLLSIHNIDLIITTVPLNVILETPVFEIKMFLSNQDRYKLSEKIKEININKQKNELRKYLTQLIIPDLFERKEDFKNKNECLSIMVNKLVENKYVEISFYDEIIKREQLSSTAFGNFAIPHSMKMNAYKTGINVMITRKPIKWDNHSVNLVLMMCFNKNERYIFNNIYDIITTILSESDNVKRIVSSKTYDEFIDNIVNSIN